MKSLTDLEIKIILAIAIIVIYLLLGQRVALAATALCAAYFLANRNSGNDHPYEHDLYGACVNSNDPSGPPERKPYTETRSSVLEGFLWGFERSCLFIIILLAVCFVIAVLGMSTIGLVVGIIGAIALIIGPFGAAIYFRVGSCPYCGSEIADVPKDGGVTCKACGKRAIFRDEKFYAVQ